jgi:hypothetical protein
LDNPRTPLRCGADSQRLTEVYAAAREAEWTEFLAECGKYLAEIDKEIATGELTLAELDEEEQSLASAFHEGAWWRWCWRFGV